MPVTRLRGREDKAMLETTSYTHVWLLLASLAIAVPAIIAIVATVRSRRLRVGSKVLWTVLLLIPVAGIAVWLGVRPTGFSFTRKRGSDQP